MDETTETKKTTEPDAPPAPTAEDIEKKLTEANKLIEDFKATAAKLPDAITASLRTGITEGSDVKRTTLDAFKQPSIFVEKALEQGCKPRILTSKPVYAECKHFDPHTGQTKITRREYTMDEKGYLYFIGKYMIAYAFEDREACKRLAAEMNEYAAKEGMPVAKQLTEGAAPGSLWIYTELLQTYLLSLDDYGRISIFSQVPVTQASGTMSYELLLPSFEWEGETEEKQVDDPTGTYLEWALHWVACIALASRDLLEDAYAVDLAAYVMNSYTRGYEAELWARSATGNHVKMPMGYENCAYINDTDAAGVLTFPIMKAAWLSLIDASRKYDSTYWFCNDYGLDAICDIRDQRNLPMFGAEQLLAAGRYPSPFGRPIQTNNNIASAAGSPVTTTIYLIDTRFYHIFKKRGSVLRVSFADQATIVKGSATYNLFQQNMVAWRFEDRLDMNCSNAAYRRRILNAAPQPQAT